MKLTVKLKLFVLKPEDEKSLQDTRMIFVDVLNYVSGIVFKEKIYNKISFQKKFYYDIKKKFSNLNSQLIIQAIRVCVSSYKSKDTRNKQHVFKKDNAVTYDARLLSYNKERDGISIATIDGRKKMILLLHPYYIDKMKSIKGEADLVYKKGSWYLYQVIEITEKEIKTQIKNLGIDLGVTNIAVDSLGNFYNKQDNDNIEKYRQKLLVLKSALQSCGTKSAKRHLKKISGIESRFRKDINHCISKKIVRLAKDTRSNIKLENLKNIRKSTTVKKKQRARHNSWSFWQLRNFIEYKSKLNGIRVFLVNPKNTSRECSHCAYIDKGNRKSQSEFLCLKCGFVENADYNAAMVISKRVGFDQPIAVRT